MSTSEHEVVTSMPQKTPDFGNDQLTKLATLVEGANVLSDGENTLSVTVMGRDNFDRGGFMAVIFAPHRYFYVNKKGVVSGMDGMALAEAHDFISHFFVDVDVSATSGSTAAKVEEVIH